MPPSANQTITFDAFQLELATRRLMCGEREVELRPKAYDVLCYLASRPGEAVSLNDLIEACWGGAKVSPNSVTNVIYQLRAVFAAASADANWIQSIARHGYRFTAPLRSITAGRTTLPTAAPPAPASRDSEPEAKLFVGRTGELARLERCWDQVMRGVPSTVFVQGEVGIGKTSLVQRFCEQLQPAPLLCIGRCIPQSREAEPYFPVLEALVNLASQVDVIGVAHDQAPTWLIQMPWLLAKEERNALRQQLAGTGAARMLREGRRLFAALAEQSPLLLVLEDVHWADHATVDLIRALSESGRAPLLMLIATYRPVDAVIADHPIRNVVTDLTSRTPNCEVLTLASLSSQQVHEYLTSRFANASLAAEIGPHLDRRSAGNPLFLEGMTNHLCDQDRIVHGADGWTLATSATDLDVGLPVGLREMIRSRLRHLGDDDRQLLEAASAAGMDFTTLDVAAALDLPASDGDERCEALAAEGQFIGHVGEVIWPDGTLGECYRFTHAAYREALLQDTPPSRRRLLHQRIGQRLELAYGKRAREVAPRLANHFAAAGNFERQVEYLKLSVQLAAGRYAHRETLAYIDRILEVLALLPATDERTALQSGWQVERSGLLMDWQGYAAGYASFARVTEMAQQQGNTFLEFFGHLGTCMCGLMGTRHRDASRHEAERLLALAAKHPELAAMAHLLAACVGDSFGDLVEAVVHAEAALVALPQALGGVLRGSDPETMIRVVLQSSLMRMGQLDRAQRERALAMQGMEQRSGLRGKAHALAFLACDALILGDPHLALELAQKSIDNAREGCFDHLLPAGEAAYEAARAAIDDDNLDDATLGRLAAAIEKRRLLDENWYNMLLAGYLADAYRRRGELQRARAQIDSTFATAEIVYAAELWRIKGEIELAAGAKGGKAQRAKAHDLAASCFRQSLSLARQHGSKLFELRGASALASLEQDDAESQEALRLVVQSFSEGRDTPELRAAMSQLESPRPSPASG